MSSYEGIPNEVRPIANAVALLGTDQTNARELMATARTKNYARLEEMIKVAKLQGCHAMPKSQEVCHDTLFPVEWDKVVLEELLYAVVTRKKLARICIEELENESFVREGGLASFFKVAEKLSKAINILMDEQMTMLKLARNADPFYQALNIAVVGDRTATLDKIQEAQNSVEWIELVGVLKNMGKS